MKKLLYVPIFCVVALLLAGCFPSERMYVVQDCTGYLCAFMPVESEFAFVKQDRGSKYEIWVNQNPSTAGGPMLVLENCEAPIEGGKFECDFCGARDSFKIVKASSSDCGLPKCVDIKLLATVACPAGGTGRGGNNED